MTVPSGSFDRAMILAGHGSLGDRSAQYHPICSNSNGRSGEHIANQGTVGTHGESGTENPEDILCLGVVEKIDLASGTSREGGPNIEYELGIWVSLSVKIDDRIVQSDVDSRPVHIESGCERHAPHFGRQGGSNHISSLLPGGQSVCSTGIAFQR
jgi:hypothetical protein